MPERSVLFALGALVLLASAAVVLWGLRSSPGPDGTQPAAAPAGSALNNPASRAAAVSEPTRKRALSAYGKLPLSFVPNQGQTDESVRYYAQGAGFAFYFTPDKAVLSFTKGKRGVALHLEPLGASPNARVEATNRVAGRVNYIAGSERHTNLPTYREIAYRDLWPGIDLVFRGQGGALKYEFRLRPGADPSKIGLAYRGAEGLSLGASGTLLVRTPLGTMRDSPPRSFQHVNGKRVPVASRYAVRKGGRAYGFTTGAHDPRRPLVIDPGLAYSTFLGGTGGDDAQAVAVDGGGSAYVSGSTSSASDFPTTAGTFDTSFNGGSGDAFVTKLNAAGTGLVYSTYLGGSGSVSLGTGNDGVSGIAVDASGSAYVAGATNSADFPTTPGAYDETFNDGGLDPFVTKLNAAGSGLAYSTYLGTNTQNESASDIAVDAGGKAYVVGDDGDGNAVVTKFNASGSALDYSTSFGGTSSETGNAIAVDGNGNAYVTGGTRSADFPTTAGAYDTTFGGGSFVNDVFVTKLNATGTTFAYSTYVGGASNEDGFGIAVDGSGAAYVTGITQSTDFPTSVGSLDTTSNGAGDAFITKLNAAGSGLGYSTYLGGTSLDIGLDVAVNGTGSAYVTGYTASPEFPTTAAGFDISHNGSDDVFVTQLSSTGAALDYSSFLGGGSFDQGKGIALDAGGSVYVAGQTFSTDYPTSAGAFDTGRSGGSDVFVSKLETSDTVGPSAPAVADTVPPSPANNNSPRVRGTAEAGTTVKIYKASTTAGCTAGNLLATGTAAGFASPGITVSVADNTSTRFRATATDTANDVSPCSPSSVVYREDSTSPALPSLTATTPNSPANNISPKVKGTAESGSTVRLYKAPTTAGCVAANLAATGTAASFASPGLTVSVPQNSTTRFRATATDAAGNVSACSTSSIVYQEVPASPNLTGTDPPSPANENAPKVKGTAVAGFTVRVYKAPTTADCIAANLAATGTAAELASPGIAVSVPDDSTTRFRATATDTGGHTSVCSASSRVYTEDSAPPPGPTLTATDPASPANNNSPRLQGTAETGSTVRVYRAPTTADCIAGTLVATGSAAAFASPGLVVSVADNSTTRFRATATDAVGNASVCSASSQRYVEDSPAPRGLAYSTFLGGTSFEIAKGIAIDGAGNAYVTGVTGSADFPTTPGAFDSTLDTNIGQDVYVTKLNATGSALGYSTFVGGTAGDTPTGIAVDGDGMAYVTGTTSSSNYPTTGGAYDTTFGAGTSDSFVTKLNAAGTDLSYSTYLGGVSQDAGGGIAVDEDGAAFVTGETFSADFPISGAWTGSEGGDVFVTKLHPSGSALAFSGLLGGPALSEGGECCSEIALDPGGNAYVTGETFSTDFLTTPGAFDTTYNGGRDAFVTKVPAGGGGIAYSTYLGGSSRDEGLGIAVDHTGSAYVTGRTDSADFANTPGALDQTYNGGSDAFVSKLDASGSALAYSTYLGGTSAESGSGIAVDGPGSTSGRAYVTGQTHSTDFPTTPGAFDTSPFDHDAFVSRLNVAGSALGYSTFLGGTSTNNIDGGRGIAVDAAGSFYVTGDTGSVDFPTTAGAFDTSLNSNQNAFVTKLDLTPPGRPTVIEVDPESPDNFNAPRVRGGAAAGSTVKIYEAPTTADCIPANLAAIGTAADFAGPGLEVSVPDDTTTRFRATATDVAGNPSVCSTTWIDYTEDSTPPPEPTLTATVPASPANNNSPRVKGTAEAGAQVRIYDAPTTANCTPANQVAAGTAANFAAGGLQVTPPLPDNSTTRFRAVAFDLAANPSPCSSSSIVYVENSTASPSAAMTLFDGPAVSPLLGLGRVVGK